MKAKSNAFVIGNIMFMFIGSNMSFFLDSESEKQTNKIKLFP